MSLVRMRSFIEVYRQRSLSRAAKALNLTQPAVSQHITGLEIAVGKPLFERTSSGVEPTAAGKELAFDIGDKLDMAEAALANARSRSMDLSGVLQIVGHADFMAEILSEPLLPLLTSGMKVRMHSETGIMIKNMLLEGHCDLGITAYPVLDERLRSERIYTSRVLPVASKAVAERIAGAKSLAQGLSEEHLLSYNLELSLIETWLKKNKLSLESLTPSLVNLDFRAQRNILIQGFGWSVMPDFLCREQIKNGDLVELPSPHGTHEIDYFLIWLPSALRQVRVSHARQTLLNLIRQR
ncbi:MULTISPECIES: LysR family transcriptional regulator [unclassified Vibrio]|uniref:LysR family transcriptional regulator n=1 Tax=Vibrio sp. HB236076 TaxID=3232307 RepID=A0AB39HKF2_9VIBR|nr:LysR family transcriptional regulator [Vibrio sp. HB161653]MDP5253078.1 LysR family transcriptional regulator [Vibrio sp. HB161653]